jgi:hypothetical protein
MKARSSRSSNVSYALRSFSAFEEPEDDAEHCVADRRLAEGSGVGGKLQLLAGGVVVVGDARPIAFGGQPVGACV